VRRFLQGWLSIAGWVMLYLIVGLVLVTVCTGGFR
jgi:hypothetical protein